MIIETPIEYYEAQLYELTHRHAVELHGSELTLKPLDMIHHIYKLKEIEDTLDTFDKAELNSNLERVIAERPAALEEYKLMKGLVDIISGLILKWDIMIPENYHYRMHGRSTVVKILDLKELTSTIVSLDTLWLATVMHLRPFSRIIEEAVKQYGIVLIKELERLLNFMLKLNHINMKRANNVVGYLAAHIPELRTKKHMLPDYTVESVEYQQLSLPTGIFHKCSKLKSSAGCLRLRKMVFDFELLYRAFEISVVRSLLLNSNKDDE